MERFPLDVLLLVVAGGLIAFGRNNSRSAKTGNISNSTVIQGDVNNNSAPTEQKPARGWVEWSGWFFTTGGFLLGAVSLVGIVQKLVQGE